MRVSKLALLPAAVLSGAACQMPEPPGELVGNYAITASLLDNTCGQDALPLAESLAYRAQLRRDGATAFWLIGAPPANQGVMNGRGEIRFEREERFTVSDDAQPVDPVLAELDPIALYGYDPFDPTAEPEDEEAPCTLIVRESIEAMVLVDVDIDSEAAEAALQGTNTIAMSPTRDSECNRVLTTAGGPFEEMPCAATYDLSGQLIEVEEEE
jgi:hypothetical protein